MNFFYGTYGFDVLSIFLLLFGSILSFNRYTRMISLVINIFVLYRALSKNSYKRSLELNKFVSIVNKILVPFGKTLPYNLPKVSLEVIPQGVYIIKNKLNQNKKYKIVKCPNCKQKLRLPRGQKKIIVTCKRCAHEFKMKT